MMWILTLASALVFFIVLVRYNSPAKEVRYWIFPAVAKITERDRNRATIEFIFVDFPSHRVLVYEEQVREFREFARTLGDSPVPVVIYQIYRFGNYRYNYGFTIESIGGRSPVGVHYNVAASFDARLLTADRAMSRQEAERILGRRVDDPLANRR